MNVYWLEQTEADLAAGGAGAAPVASLCQNGRAPRSELEWLSTREVDQFNAMRFAKRRGDWQLGRWTAKRAAAACLQLPADFHNLAQIEVRAASSGAPEIFLGNKWAPVTISLSHRAGRAICAIARHRGALGCDLEIIEPHSDAFIADYFATEEQALVSQAAAADRPGLATLLWSAKESALKALRTGLRLDTRRVIVTLVDAERNQDENGEVCAQEACTKDWDFPALQRGRVNDWLPLRVQHLNDQTFLGWWQRAGNLLRTMVSAPPPARPRLLNIPSNSARSSEISDLDQFQAA